MRRIVLSLCAVCLAWTAAAQESFDFETLDIRKGGVVDFDLEAGRPIAISQGADIVIYMADGDEELRIRATAITFSWPAEGAQPNSVTLDGNVIVDHPRANIRSARAVWQVSTGVLEFTGEPVLSTPQVKEMRAARMEFNLETQRARTFDTAATGIHLSTGPGEDRPAAALTVDAIRDWPALIGALQTAHRNGGPSPGGQILKFVDPAVRQYLPNIEPARELDTDNQRIMVSELNKALRQPLLYNDEAWQGISLGGEATAMLERGIDTLPPRDVVLLNRRLIEAAWPGAIAPAPSDGAQ